MQRDRLSIDQRRYTLVYNDFLESDLLSYYEKLVFIFIKKHANYQTLKAFPSVGTLADEIGISKRQVQRCLKLLREKNIITVEKRIDEGQKSNLYTLHDYASIWGIKKDSTGNIDREAIREAVLVEELRALGYTVTKEEEPTSATGKSADASSTNNLSNNHDTKIGYKKQSQDVASGKQATTTKKSTKKNAFNDFEQRTYDYTALESALVSRSTVQDTDQDTK